MTLLQMSPAGDLNGTATPEHLGATLHRLSIWRNPLSTIQVAERLGRVAQAWLEDPRWLDLAEEHSSESGVSPEMMRWGLLDLIKRITPRSLVALVESELGTLEPFQAPRSRDGHPCARGARPPNLVFQVLAGTVPPVGIEAILLACLVRSPTLIKTSRAEPTAARLFLKSLREYSPDLAEGVSVMTWEGGSSLDTLAVRHAEVVSAFGSDAAINALLRQCEFPTRFFGYGHRVSFSVINGQLDVPLSTLAERIALDVAAYDQHGCMSPHCVFIGDDAPFLPEDLAAQVANHGFPAAAEWFPPAPLPADLAAVQTQQVELARLLGRVWRSDSGTVILHRSGGFQASPGCRTIHILPFRDLPDLLGKVEDLRGSISTVGLLVDPLHHDEFCLALGRLGALRICRIGRMQRPLWLRDHDGRPRIGDWVTWTNVEPL